MLLRNAVLETQGVCPKRDGIGKSLRRTRSSQAPLPSGPGPHRSGDRLQEGRLQEDMVTAMLAPDSVRPLHRVRTASLCVAVGGTATLEMALRAGAAGSLLVHDPARALALMTDDEDQEDADEAVGAIEAKVAAVNDSGSGSAVAAGQPVRAFVVAQTRANVEALRYPTIAALSR